MDSPLRIRVRITGRVQGVGFRMAALREAESLGLAGWIRNAPDGAVEAEFQGIAPAVETMLSWCERGPRFARVDRVESDRIPEDPAAVGFAIR